MAIQETKPGSPVRQIFFKTLDTMNRIWDQGSNIFIRPEVMDDETDVLHVTRPGGIVETVVVKKPPTPNP